MPIHACCFQERKGIPSGLFGVTNGTRITYTLFHTNACVLAPIVTFYDAKPQLIKTPVEGKPSTISPNHTYQSGMGQALRSNA